MHTRFSSMPSHVFGFAVTCQHDKDTVLQGQAKHTRIHTFNVHTSRVQPRPASSTHRTWLDLYRPQPTTSQVHTTLEKPTMHVTCQSPAQQPWCAACRRMLVLVSGLRPCEDCAHVHDCVHACLPACLSCVLCVTRLARVQCSFSPGPDVAVMT